MNTPIIDDEKIAVARLSRDLREAAETMGQAEARFLVDAYYMIQADRIRASNQLRSMGETGEPNSVLGWLAEQSDVLEGQIKAALDRYSDNHPVGKWMRSQKGIGPVIAAGYLGHIDIERAQTAGAIWRFAGLDPTSKWGKGQKRPWNADLKTLCWKTGQSFMKVSGSEDAYYGQAYRYRKSVEWERNLSGENATYAEGALLQKSYSKTSDAYAWLSGQVDPDKVLKALQAGSLPAISKLKASGQGVAMVPPAQVDARARRWAVKLFLAHLHEVWRTHEGLDCPAPFAIEHLGHAHYLTPPNWSKKKAA